MRTILVDDEKIAMDLFEVETKSISYMEIVGKFENAMDALEFVKKNPIELAVLDIRMVKMDGIELGKNLRKIIPNLMLIYITGYEEYAMDAYKIHAAAYLLKPYSKADIEYAIESAMLLSKRQKAKYMARTFGHFDFFVDGKPILFQSAKAKELLALLIDRQGGSITTEQIIAVLWEDRPNNEATQNLCSKVIKTLTKELKKYGLSQLILGARGVRSIDTSLFECDLYDLLDGKKEAKDKFCGEYMVEYSWAEEKTAILCEKFC